MKTTPKTHITLSAIVLSIGLGFGSLAAYAVDTNPYLVNLNSREATNLGTLGGATGEAYGINDVGQVVGWSFNAAGKLHAFITQPGGGGMSDLGTLGGDVSKAEGVNDAGQVAGWSSRSKGYFSPISPFVTGPDGVGMKGLTAADNSGIPYGEALGINNAGQVLAQIAYQDPGGELNWRNLIIGPNGEVSDLGDGQFYGINDSGQVAGDSNGTAFITGPNGIGRTRIAADEIGASVHPIAINDVGQVAGTFLQDGQSHAFITGSSGPNGIGVIDLGTLGGGFSFAFGVNDMGQVVGRSTTAEGYIHAFVTGPDGVGMTDLNTLADLPKDVILVAARGINNSGQVIATSVPEPESYALMLAGLILIGFMTRRKCMGYNSFDGRQALSALPVLQEIKTMKGYP